MPWRKLLFPLSIVYGIITGLRNLLYDLGILATWNIPVKSICVGNLSTGGTGKTPHVAYLASYFSKYRKVAILSRGYGRYTKGFKMVTNDSLASEVGDEPLSYALLFGEKVTVAVCESRKKGIQQLLRSDTEIDLILLDDAYQHRAVRAGFSILLTKFNKPFSSDLLLPAGDLRECQGGKKRADLVVVTKCPDIESTNSKIWASRLKLNEKLLYFSDIEYGEPVPFGKPEGSFENILLVTGIADPSAIESHLKRSSKVTHFSFGDHHSFSLADIQKIHQKFDTFTSQKSVILTTEKDFMRLRNHITEWNISEYPWYYLPISVRLNNETEFLNTIRTYVDNV